MLRISALSLLVLLALTACGAEPTQSSESLSGLVAVDPDAEAELLVWRDLMPDADLEALEALVEGRADPSLMSQLGEQSTIEGQIGTFNIVEDLDGLVVRMPGYILPLDFAENGSAQEFLLLPYHGACVHVPPPPPNQIVYLRAPEPVRFNSLWEPVWVEGRMEIERVDTELAATAYSMVVRSVEPYQVR
ncbi:DUF3299 domain-containing protein [Oceanicaulis sp.]|uniref:DUF3299 domain-containing protein n=1 Tax=Oceanicaulis sp. TaxID=1924941 RepID=UPI003BAB07E9